MSLAVTEEHAALAASLRRFLGVHCSPAQARAGLDAETEDLPAFWEAFAAQGWLGLGVAEDVGGEGYGLEEVAVVLEELGRVGAPGPFLPTLAAAALIAWGGDRAQRERWLPGLAGGSIVGAVALPATAAVKPAPAGGPVPVRPILGGHLADVVVVPVASPGGGTAWSVHPLDRADRRELPSLDPSRRVGEVTVDLGGGQPLGIDDGIARSVLAALVAAECAGGADWCVQTAADYAQVRVQFGRPIGQFQAVKHRCANMAIQLEQIRAAAWDAAAALGRDPDGPGTSLSCALAGAVAAPAFLAVAEDCIQVLGGIGFTWEHDAQRYLRRASCLAALAGPAARWRREAVAQAATGVRRTPASPRPAAETVELRETLRAQIGAIAAEPKERQREALVDAGLFVPHWPRPWGRAATAAEQIVIDEELERAGLRRANLAVGAWAAPTIAAHGNTEQQQRWVRPTLLGEIRWCQLFSEPGAGSDLASLATRATPARGPQGEPGWRLDGQKVWTSLAQEADFGICLARTDPDAPKHRGITYFVLDMSVPGIDIRPLRELTGMAMFNEVFLDGVFVPAGNVIGEVNGGWALARTTLANERVAMGSGSSFGGGMEALLSLVAGLGVGALDPTDVDQLGRLLGESHCLSVMGRRSAHRAVAGAGPGPESSVRKLLAAEHDQRTQELGLSLLGAEAATTEGRAAQWSFGFLANRCLTIAGGTSEVQRNVIGERLLGLPRDPD